MQTSYRAGRLKRNVVSGRAGSSLAPDQAASVQFGVPPTGYLYDKATVFLYGATASIERKF